MVAEGTGFFVADAPQNDTKFITLQSTTVWSALFPENQRSRCGDVTGRSGEKVNCRIAAREAGLGRRPLRAEGEPVLRRGGYQPPANLRSRTIVP